MAVSVSLVSMQINMYNCCCVPSRQCPSSIPTLLICRVVVRMVGNANGTSIHRGSIAALSLSCVVDRVINQSMGRYLLSRVMNNIVLKAILVPLYALLFLPMTTYVLCCV